MFSLKKYLIEKLTLEQRLILLQKLNIPKDSIDDEFMKYLLENKDYKSFCQEENSKEAQMSTKECLFIKNFIAKNLDVKVDAKKRKKINICEEIIFISKIFEDPH